MFSSYKTQSPMVLQVKKISKYFTRLLSGFPQQNTWNVSNIGTYFDKNKSIMSHLRLQKSEKCLAKYWRDWSAILLLCFWFAVCVFGQCISLFCCCCSLWGSLKWVSWIGFVIIGLHRVETSLHPPTPQPDYTFPANLSLWCD